MPPKEKDGAAKPQRDASGLGGLDIAALKQKLHRPEKRRAAATASDFVLGGDAGAGAAKKAKKSKKGKEDIKDKAAKPSLFD